MPQGNSWGGALGHVLMCSAVYTGEVYMYDQVHTMWSFVSPVRRPTCRTSTWLNPEIRRFFAHTDATMRTPTCIKNDASFSLRLVMRNAGPPQQHVLWGG